MSHTHILIPIFSPLQILVPQRKEPPPVSSKVSDQQDLVLKLKPRGSKKLDKLRVKRPLYTTSPQEMGLFYNISWPVSIMLEQQILVTNQDR